MFMFIKFMWRRMADYSKETKLTLLDFLLPSEKIQYCTVLLVLMDS